MFGTEVSFCFNRKETKNHGEGGNLIGTPLNARKAIIIDDVITSGISVKESRDIIYYENGALVGICVALDRQERCLDSKLSAIQEIEHEYNVPVKSIITFTDILEYCEMVPELSEHVVPMKQYHNLYGIKT